jgi:hypothetical protein
MKGSAGEIRDAPKRAAVRRRRISGWGRAAALDAGPIHGPGWDRGASRRTRRRGGTIDPRWMAIISGSVRESGAGIRDRTFVVLGVHYGDQALWLARKPFVTPLGEHRGSRSGGLARATSRFGNSDGRLLPRRGHSIEFRSYFCSMSTANIRILPILCGPHGQHMQGQPA